MSSSDTPAAEGEELQPGEALNESISFLAPAIGSYYFAFSALDRVSAFYDANPLSMYRMAPVGKLPSKAPPPAMSVNLPPNATQAQRMQVRILLDTFVIIQWLYIIFFSLFFLSMIHVSAFDDLLFVFKIAAVVSWLACQPEHSCLQEPLSL
jgi:hypothetical protein